MLGPLEVRTDGDPGEIIEVTGARLRALLTCWRCALASWSRPAS